MLPNAGAAWWQDFQAAKSGLLTKIFTAQHSHLIVGGSGGVKLAVEFGHVRVSLAKARLVATGPGNDGRVVLIPLDLQRIRAL